MSNALPLSNGRYWINAPATTQPYHEYHGFIGILSGDNFFFADGGKGRHQHDASSIYAGDLLRQYLSEGWPDHLRRDAANDQIQILQQALETERASHASTKAGLEFDQRNAAKSQVESAKLLDQVASLKAALAEIGKTLSEHPDFKRGNSKVHYCAHKALGAVQ